RPRLAIGRGSVTIPERTALHVLRRLLDRAEADLLVEAVRVTGREDPAAEALEVGMGDDRLHEPGREALSARLLEHEHVAHPRERLEVRDDAREADLPPARLLVDAEAEGAPERALDLLARDARRPVRAREVAVDDVDLQAAGT